MSTLVVANGGARAFKEPADRQKFEATMQSHLPGAEILFTSPETPVADKVRKAVEHGVTLVVACGGDGTISEIAAALINTSATLAVIPSGTFNHFAKDLHIPLETDKALEVIATRHELLVDVGEVNGRCFVNNSGLGLYPDAVAMREARRQRGARKMTSAFIAGMKSLMRYRLLAIRVLVDEETLLRRTPVVFVGNNEYVMDAPFEPTRASLTDGQLCLYIPHPHGRLKLVWFAIRAMFGKLTSAPQFDVVRTSSFTIESRHHLRVSLDGEIETMQPPLEYRVLPRALRVLVPHDRNISAR